MTFRSTTCWTRLCWWRIIRIKYSVEDYAVVISAKPSGPEPPVLEMRVFKVDPNTFYDGLQSVSK